MWGSFVCINTHFWVVPQTALPRELHVCNSKGTAALFVCFCSSLNNWLIRNSAKNSIQHETGRCLVFLKCAHDVVRGKGDAIGGNIVSLKRFGFSEPRKIFAFIVVFAFIMESQAVRPISSFLRKKKKIQICNCMAETMFLRIHCCELL